MQLESEQLDLYRFEQLCAKQPPNLEPSDRCRHAPRSARPVARTRRSRTSRTKSFAQATIARLEEARLAALDARIEADMQLGRHAELVGELATLAHDHPLRERLRAAQMLALYRSGRQADALAVYQSARHALVDELGIEPGRALHALERDILKQESSLYFVPAERPSVDSARTHQREAEAREGAVHERSGANEVLLGRERELAALRAGLDESIEGRGRLFLVSGEPGIGKSRLIDDFAHSAVDAGARVLSGRCWEAGGAPAYWPWCQSIRAYVRTCDPEVLARLAGGASDVAALVPEIRDVVAGVPAASRSRDPDIARFRLFDSTAGFLRRAAAREPLVLVLDDLHAADTPSLILLQFLARELSETGILIVAGYRDTDLARSSPLTETLVALRREPVTRILPLSGLGRDDVARFIRLTAGTTASESMIDAINAQTEGNPLFLGEVVRLLVQEGRLSAMGHDAAQRLGIPHGVREAISLRLGHLSESCNEILVLASILGREFRLDALERISGFPRSEILERLDQAFTSGLISEGAGVPAACAFRMPSSARPSTRN